MEPIYEYNFEVFNEDLKKRHRTIRSILSPSEIKSFCETGYLLLEDLIEPAVIEELREATEDLRQKKYGESQKSTYSSQSFAGQYLREPHTFDCRFWKLLDRQPIIDSVRAILGPRIVMRSYSVRITFQSSQAGTKWHRDQRSLVNPPPPLFTEPNVITALLYLDDADDNCGPTFLIPNSYRQLKIIPSENYFDTLEEQIKLCPRAGSVLLFHSAMWHRGGANGMNGHLRRMIIQQFAPAWSQRSSFEPVDTSLLEDLIRQARDEEDEEMLEILGFGGYM